MKRMFANLNVIWIVVASCAMFALGWATPGYMSAADTNTQIDVVFEATAPEPIEAIVPEEIKSDARDACDVWMEGDYQSDLVNLATAGFLIDKKNGFTKIDALKSVVVGWGLLRDSEVLWNVIESRFGSVDAAWEAYSTCVEAIIDDVWLVDSEETVPEPIEAVAPKEIGSDVLDACDVWIPRELQGDLVTLTTNAFLIDSKRGFTKNGVLESLKPSWDSLTKSPEWWDAMKGRFGSKDEAWEAYNECMVAIIEDVWTE